MCVCVGVSPYVRGSVTCQNGKENKQKHKDNTEVSREPEFVAGFLPFLR